MPIARLNGTKLSLPNPKFLGKKKTINAEPIVVLDSSEKKIYKKFAKEYIHKSLRKMKTYWVRMLFTGKKIPPKKFSLQELSTLDSQNSCYISYMEEEKIPTNWKEISIK